MKLILVSGAEATCKSAISKALAAKLNYEYLSKDVIKEKLFDEKIFNTWNIKAYYKKSKELFFNDIKRIINNNKDSIIESNFIGKDKIRLLTLLSNNVEIVEVHCYSNAYVSFVRFVKRNESGRRHPGHHDRRWYLDVLFQSTMHILHVNLGAHKTVGISTHVINLDTTQYPDINNEALESLVKSS